MFWSRHTACLDFVCDYEHYVQMCNQSKNLWQSLHLEHMRRQPIILHLPLVTDASTSHLQACMTILHTHTVLDLAQRHILRLSKHDDVETCKKYLSFCSGVLACCLSDCTVSGLWASSGEVKIVTASASLDLISKNLNWFGFLVSLKITLIQW